MADVEWKLDDSGNLHFTKIDAGITQHIVFLSADLEGLKKIFGK